MEQLVERYLLRYKKCPLPELGILELSYTSAISSLAERKIHAPVPAIRLVEKTGNTDAFIRFIASEMKSSNDEASGMLNDFCTKLQNMDAYGETKLPHTGKFYVNAEGNIVFKCIEVPPAFVPEVTAERVVHPNASHSMTVGDRETTSAEMTAFYTVSENGRKERWWIAAVILFVVAVASILVYFNGNHSSGTFGNSKQVEPRETTITHQVAE